MTRSQYQRYAVQIAREACEKSGRKFAVVHLNVMGAGYAFTFDRLKECTEYARNYCGPRDTYASVYGYSYNADILYCFGYDQLPFRFRAFRIDR